MSAARDRSRGKDCRKCGADEWYQNRGRYFVCGPCQRRRTKRRYKDPVVRLYQWAQTRAKRNGRRFTLRLADIRAVYGPRCPVFGSPWGRGDRVATLDCLRPELGYTPGNIAVISLRANQIKSNARAKEVEKVAQWMRQQGL